ncbi:RidA family protein [Rhodobacteraceae bacterium F11138]|nr:RidA family protein [Rhodobacteraceae bacterium F11138]
MSEITRVRGHARGRNSGSAANGFAWAVATSQVATDDLYEQTHSTLARIDAILARMNTDRTRAVTATVYITDITQKQQMDRAWCEWVGDDPAHWPQRACVEAALHENDLVEVVLMVAL